MAAVGLVSMETDSGAPGYQTQRLRSQHRVAQCLQGTRVPPSRCAPREGRAGGDCTVGTDSDGRDRAGRARGTYCYFPNTLKPRCESADADTCFWLIIKVFQSH